MAGSITKKNRKVNEEMKQLVEPAPADATSAYINPPKIKYIKGLKVVSGGEKSIPYDQKRLMKEDVGKPISAPPIKVERGTAVEKEGEGKKKGAIPTPVKQPVKPDIKLSAEITALEPDKLLDLITLDYGTEYGMYKGKNWIGGVHGLCYGEDVAIVQLLYNELIDIGAIKGEKIAVNGKYDDITKNAIKGMQNAAGVEEDGFFGIDTKTGLYILIAQVPEVPKEKEEKEEEEEGEKPPEKAVMSTLTFTREIDKDQLKPPKGITQLMDENFYISTDAGLVSAKDMVKKNLNEIDNNWDTDKETAKTIAPKENWETKTLTRKNVGVFSWANTKKVLFPYLLASGQEFEFKTWELLEADNGVKIPAGKVIRGKITEYDELTGEFKVEILAVQDNFTSKPEPEATSTVAAEGEGETDTAGSPTR